MGQRNSILPIATDELNNGSHGAVQSGLGGGGVAVARTGSIIDGIPKDEFPHFGIVSVQLSWLTANVRYTPEQQSDITVTGKGAIFYGTNTASPEIMTELHQHKLFPKEISLLDSRAHQLLVTYSNGWHAISSPEIFSRHSGTCIIIGDRANPGPPYKIQLGDCFRLGSVGVVVSEIKNDKGIEKKLDNKRLQYLREEALAFESEQDEAALAAEEEEYIKKKQKSNISQEAGGANDENTSYNCQADGASQFFCYMCYETHDTPEDHLVAPCECKGDTRYLHVQCLQKWYQSSVCGSQALVIRTTSNGAPACKICGAAYKTAFRNNGVKTSLLEVDHPGPYISLVVVTRHDTSPGLFNTKFRLNFGPSPTRPEEEAGLTELSIGRSSLCNMVLDYRTVSTVHAKLIYKNGEFFVQDTHSSNGTMVYLQGPLPLVNNQMVRLRMGRSTLALQAKRSLSASIRGTLQRAPLTTPCTASLPELQDIMSLAPPYIPRSIRQGDPSADQNLSDMPQSVPVPNNSLQNDRMRLQDVNNWLNSLHQTQSGQGNRLDAGYSDEGSMIGLNGYQPPQNSHNYNFHTPFNHQDEEVPVNRERNEISHSISFNHMRENHPIMPIEENEAEAKQDREKDQSQSQEPIPSPRLVGFSSPLPCDVLNVFHGDNTNTIDGPIVLGGDRVTGSRPTSARPASASSKRVYEPLSPLSNPTVAYTPSRTFSPTRDVEQTVIASRQNSNISTFPSGGLSAASAEDNQQEVSEDISREQGAPEDQRGDMGQEEKSNDEIS